jgi:hypothetical protein
MDHIGATIRAFVDKQNIAGLSDYYDRGDAEIERLRKDLTRSVSRFYHNAQSTVKTVLVSVPRSCDQLIRDIPTQIPGNF